MTPDRLRIAAWAEGAGHGYSLPLFGHATRPNLFFTAECSIPGYHLGTIVGFHPVNIDQDINILKEAQPVVEIGSSWQDIFIWDAQPYAGNPAELWKVLRPKFAAMRIQAPLSLLDLALNAQSDEAPEIAATAFKYLERTFIKDRALSWRNQLLNRMMTTIVRRFAHDFPESVTFGVTDNQKLNGYLPEIVENGAYAAELAQLAEIAFALNGNDLPLLKLIRSTAAAVGSEFQFSRDIGTTVTEKSQTPARKSGITLAPSISPYVPRARHGNYDVLIVGAGFAGSVLAERLAAGSGKRVLLIDRRAHIGGNASDYNDAAGILVHRYGPHIFHTNSEEVFRYLSRFTRWRPYEHRVLASVHARLLPIPINRTTLNEFYGMNLSDDAQAAAFLATRAEPREIRTSEDVVVAAVGQELYETFFRGYTRKQWGLDPSQLDRSVTARVPTRTSTDDRYFQDRFQFMPVDGYTRMFENMIDHDLIDIELGVDFRDVVNRMTVERTIFTGQIDEYFDYRFGALPYRSLDFVHETHNMEQFQPVAVVNYPSEETPYTRITEYKHLTGQRNARTSISYEYSSASGSNPYYPIPRAENQALYKRYEALADALPDVSFVGRLATYRYYNMDQVVGQALATYRKLDVERRHTKISVA